jgi:TRAP-type C4-dicarboxylate transport system permease small subunit
MKLKTRVNKFMDVLIVITNTLFILGVSFLWYKGVQGMATIISSTVDFNSASLYAALLVGMAGGIMYILASFISGLTTAVKRLKK